MTPGLRLAAVLALALLARGASAADAVTAAQQSRMTDVAVRVMPIGHIMERVSAGDPAWPGKPDSRLDKDRLACLRGNLGEPAYRRVMEKRVADYAQTEPARFAESLAFLEGDAGRLMGKAMLAGAETRIVGKRDNADIESVLKDERPDAIFAMLSLASDPRYTGLRAMLGIGAQITDEDSGRQIGQAAGLTMMLPMMSEAMSACNVRFEDL